MNWDDDTKKYIERRRKEDVDAKFANSWRVVCDGVVIDQTPVRHGEAFCKRMCNNYIDHIRSALTDPDWVFEGAGGVYTGPEWIKDQEDRLGTKLSLSLECVPPGDVLPYCEAVR